MLSDIAKTMPQSVATRLIQVAVEFERQAAKFEQPPHNQGRSPSVVSITAYVVYDTF
jgi:hypothetical protein